MAIGPSLRLSAGFTLPRILGFISTFVHRILIRSRGIAAPESIYQFNEG